MSSRRPFDTQLLALYDEHVALVETLREVWAASELNPENNERLWLVRYRLSGLLNAVSVRIATRTREVIREGIGEYDYFTYIARDEDMHA